MNYTNSYKDGSLKYITCVKDKLWIENSLCVIHSEPQHLYIGPLNYDVSSYIANKCILISSLPLVHGNILH
jgi:hypothetical protein